MISDYKLRNFGTFNLGGPTGPVVVPIRRDVVHSGSQGAYDAMPAALSKRFRFISGREKTKIQRGGLSMREFAPGGAFDQSPETEALTALYVFLHEKLPEEDRDQAKRLLEHLVNVSGLKNDTSESNGGDEETKPSELAGDSRARANSTREPSGFLLGIMTHRNLG